MLAHPKLAELRRVQLPLNFRSTFWCAPDGGVSFGVASCRIVVVNGRDVLLPPCRHVYLGGLWVLLTQECVLTTDPAMLVSQQPTCRQGLNCTSATALNKKFIVTYHTRYNRTNCKN